MTLSEAALLPLSSLLSLKAVLLLPLPPLKQVRSQQSMPEGAGEVVLPGGAEEVAEIAEIEAVVAAADPTMADKIIIKGHLIKISLTIKTKVLTPNLTNGVHAMPMGLQIPVAPGTGPKGAELPTVPTLSSVVGPTSLPLGLNKIKIEKLAVLE